MNEYSKSRLSGNPREDKGDKKRGRRGVEPGGGGGDDAIEDKVRGRREEEGNFSILRDHWKRDRYISIFCSRLVSKRCLSSLTPQWL